MDTEGGGTDSGESVEEGELNILQGFDFDQNHDATWLLTSPINSPGAGISAVKNVENGTGYFLSFTQELQRPSRLPFHQSES